MDGREVDGGNFVMFAGCWGIELNCGVSLRVFGVFQVENKELKLWSSFVWLIGFRIDWTSKF